MPTTMMNRTDLASLTSQLDAGLIPPDLDGATAVEELDGVALSTFTNGHRPPL
jgi:hypothetical protein